MRSSNLPAGWKEVKIGDVLKRIKKPVILEPNMVYREIGIRSHGKGIFHKEECTGASIGEKSVFWVEPDCFIVNIVFAWERAIAKTTINEKGMIASHRFPMYKVVEGRLNLDFLIYFFNSPRGKHLLELASPGGAGRNKTLGQQEFLNLSILLPSYEEQCKTVEILQTWENDIELCRNLIALKRRFKQALVSQLLKGELRYPNSSPENWKRKKLSECLIDKPQYGANLPSVKYSEDLPRYIRITDIDEFGSLINSNKVGIPVGYSERHVLHDKDFLIARTGATVGKTYLYKKDDGVAVYAGYLIRFRLDESILLPEFLEQFSQSYEYKRWVKGTFRLGAQPNINASEYADLELQVPSLLEQKKIITVLQVLDKEISLINEKLLNVQKQKKWLVQKLLSGYAQSINKFRK